MKIIHSQVLRVIYLSGGKFYIPRFNETSNMEYNEVLLSSYPATPYA
jgi:hypothetical protein